VGLKGVGRNPRFLNLGFLKGQRPGVGQERLKEPTVPGARAFSSGKNGTALPIFKTKGLLLI